MKKQFIIAKLMDADDNKYWEGEYWSWHASAARRYDSLEDAEKALGEMDAPFDCVTIWPIYKKIYEE